MWPASPSDGLILDMMQAGHGTGYDLLSLLGPGQQQYGDLCVHVGQQIGSSASLLSLCHSAGEVAKVTSVCKVALEQCNPASDLSHSQTGVKLPVCAQ